MAYNQQSGPAGAGPAPETLFGLPRPLPGSYDEAFQADQALRGHWRDLAAFFEADGPDGVEARQERIRRMRFEDGATFNPFSDPGGSGDPWDLEVVPLLLTEEDWRGLEAGLIQRARLLEMILADVYGPQRLLLDGRLPAELVYANPAFLRPCHLALPAGRRHLVFYAVDLYRDPQGNFRVLRDFASNPAGLGYALENRIVISRVLGGPFHQARIRRLAPFFQTFQNTIARGASRAQEDSAAVLLSPGPDSPIYFEHALLSRYLGYPLVEGEDLTVRDGKVFLKKLAGLEAVEAIFRHVADSEIDPFALRKTTRSGVAGLIQAGREGNIDVVNPVGSGFGDTPALSTVLPGLCRYLLGEDLRLENHPAWWCGSPAGLEYVRSQPDRLTVSAALGPAPALDPSQLPAAMEAQPHLFLAREALQASSVPAWSSAGPRSRYGMMRMFVCATEHDFEVMPGALAITADRAEALLEPDPRAQQSKDVWVLSAQPVDTFSLMSSLRAVAEFRRGSDLPSRVADNLLWLGRYLERAECLVRLLRAIYRRLSGETAQKDISELSFLLGLLAPEGPAARPEGPEGADGAEGVEEDLPLRLQAALFDEARPDSVQAVLQRVRQAARNVRDRLSLGSWQAISRLEGFSANAAGDPLELLDDTLFDLSAFSGLAMESMTRGLGWRFMDMGRRLERAMNQTRLITLGLSRAWPEPRSTLEAMLEASDSIMTYRARYRASFQLGPVLDLLIMDESNPKSIAFQCSQLVEHVENLPRQNERRYSTPEERITLEMLTSVRLLELGNLDDEGQGPQQEDLRAFLEFMHGGLAEFAREITAHYLARVPNMPHFSEGLGGTSA